MLNIKYRQTIEEAYPTIVSADTNESIQPKLLRKINFLKYETTSVPSRELRLDTQKGAGLLINNIIERFIADNEEGSVFLNNEQVGKLTEFINGYLVKIRSFKDYAIKATVAPNPTDMLTSLFYLSDGDRKIDTTGSGVQYMAMASINILCQIMELYKSKSAPFNGQLYKDDDDKMILPLVLSIDEPEVHLHPYLQRSLIGYYKRILNNEDTEFVELLKTCFGIDGIDGQLIIVTHSTDALIGDYRNLIRFYKDGDKTAVVSGADPSLKFTTVNEKHLIEWDYVFIADVERWVFPGYYICNVCVDKFTPPVNCRCHLPNPMPDDFKETALDELSVFYVGITRARKQVFISASAKRLDNYGEKNSNFSCLSSINGITLIKAV